MISPRRILAISPHPDDAELAAGGTIHRFAAEGAEIRVLCLSDCDNPQLGPEMHRSLEHLGVVSIIRFSFPVRRFDEHRQKLLEVLREQGESFGPDTVLCPSSVDEHQDHIAVYGGALRAFRGTTVLGYENPWANRVFPATLHVRLSKDNVDAKLRALASYDSQRHRSYFSPDYLHGWARMRGVQAQTKHAEAFEVIRAAL